MKSSTAARSAHGGLTRLAGQLVHLVWALAMASAVLPRCWAQSAPIAAIASMPSPVCKDCAAWPLWEEFKHHHLDSSGRIRDDPQHDSKTVSEGQAYGLFFALVANDRHAFERILHWSDQHLAQGQLGEQLMSWHWGRNAQGQWQVLDTNAATDADVWMAYTLLEAADIWKNPAWAELGLRLVKRLSSEASANAQGLGVVLLPGQHGFVQPPHRWLLNPSYYPPPVMQRLANATTEADWPAIANNAQRTLLDTLLKFKYPPDWVFWDAQQAWQPELAEGSYDAIRVYLWIALSSASDRQQLCPASQAWLAWIDQHHRTPERWPARHPPADPADDVATAGTGFDAVAWALASACGHTTLAQKIQQRFCQSWDQVPRTYYQRALALFATGWLEQRFVFDPQARLIRAPVRSASPRAMAPPLCQGMSTDLPKLG